MSAPDGVRTGRGSWRGSWRVSLRYAWRDVRRHKGRTALIAIMVALPSGLGAAAAVIAVSTSESPASRVAAQLGTDRDVQASVSFQGPGHAEQDPADMSSGVETGDLSSPLFRTADGARTADDWTAVLPVDTAAYENALAATLPDGDSLVPVTGTWDATLTSTQRPALHASVTTDQLDTTSSAARSVYDLSTALPQGQIAISSDVAHDLRLGVGDGVRLEQASDSHRVDFYAGNGSSTELGTATKSLGEFTVAEVTRSAGYQVVLGASGPLKVPPSLDFWRSNGDEDSAVPQVSWLVTGSAPVTWNHITRANDLGATVFSRTVVMHPPADAVEAYQAKYYPDGSGTSVSSQAAAVVGGAVVLGLLQAVLMIGPAFQVGARRSARDLSLLAANGADARTIRRTVLAGAVVVGTVSSVAATTLGGALAIVGLRAWSTMEPLVPWVWLVAFAAVGTLIAVAAAWLPARRASRLDPALVLSGRRADPDPRRWPAVVGTALAGAGVVVALVGAATHLPIMLLVAGIVVAEVGLVIASGSIVGAIARLARSLPGTSRLALRDAARHRARTAPAVAAVLAATAAAVAGLVVASSQAQHDRLSYVPDAAAATLLVGPLGDSRQSLDAADAASIRQIVDQAGVLDGTLIPVTGVLTKEPYETPVSATPQRDPGGSFYSNGGRAIALVVDDGSSVRRLELLGVPEPVKAAAALRAGRVVVPQQDIAADGTAALTVSLGDDDSRTVHVPAAAVGGPLDPSTNLPVLPPTVAHDLGLRTGTAALVGTVRAGSWNNAVQTTLDLDLEAAVPAPLRQQGPRYATASAYVEPGHAAWGDSPLLSEALIAGGALLVALAAAWIATALAGTESLPDLATLQAVGAPPRTRRRFAAAQSAVITVTGAALGAATGLVIGATVVIAQRERPATPDPRWMVDVPWLWVLALVVTIPVLGALAAWAVTRSRLPMTRRIDR